MFDIAVIGAGISGAGIAYFLNRAGKKVIVFESGKIAGGGSGAAGAFLSPKICSNSDYSRFINESFRFSIDFYKKNFPDHLTQEGMLRLLKNEEDIEKCQKFEGSVGVDHEYLKQSDIKYVKPQACEFGGYFFKDAALIDGTGLIYRMLDGIEVLEDTVVDELVFENNLYKIGGIEAKGVVICTGGSFTFPEVEYCMIKKIYGHRLDISTSIQLPFAVHKEYSISANKNGMVHIGATHIPGYRYDEEDDHEVEIDQMLKMAETYIDLGDHELQKVHFGIRSSTIDFFPVIGKVINTGETLKKYPYIKNGSKVPSDKYVHYPNLYIHSGLGARGFVLAPKTASILSELICNNSPIDDKLNTTRLFLKYSRR